MGEMNRRERVIKDAKAIDKVMCHYSGKDGVHFGFIAYDTGERHFFVGGKVDLACMCIGEALATMVHNTESLDAGFIDAVADMAKIMLNEMGKVKAQ